MNQNKKILVTGGYGQLGTFVVNSLVREGYRPIVIDKTQGSTDRVEFYSCDLLQENEICRLSEKLSEIQCAIHLASVVDGSIDVLDSAAASIELNILATVRLLSLLPNLEHFVFASSMMVYGEPKSAPISERHETEPVNVYGASKLATEKFLQVYSRQKNVTTTILRLSSLYGPGEYSSGNQNRVIPLFVQKIKNNEPLIAFPGDEQEIRDYLHLQDAADAFLAAIQKKAGGVFNIGSGKGISIRELMERMVHLSGKEVQCQMRDRRPSRAADYTLDISKARGILGLEPQISIETGLAEELKAVV